MSKERFRVYYSGRVQGVGFRFLSRHLAQRFAVNGYVRNLDDGRVEIVAEGEPSEVNAFLDAVRLELGDKVRNVEVESEPADGPSFSGFTIRY